MHELQEIIKAFEVNQQQGENTFLATIVNSFGSTYRQKGAKMLITETGEIVGTLSGGCVENDIFQYTKQISDEPLLISYDATSEEDLIWGFGLGCNGAVQILLEKLDYSWKLSPLNLINECLTNKKHGAIATIFEIEGEIDVKLGSRFFVYPDNTTHTDIQEQNLKKAITDDTISAKNTRQSTVNKYQSSLGSVDVFIEVITPPLSLIIFGAGRDVLPVAKLAKAIGWQVTVVDCRAQEKTYQRFAFADKIILTRRDIISQQISVEENDVAVVMTHNYFDDYNIIKFLLPTKISYLGVMGSKNRIAKIIEDLNPTKTQLEKLYSPIGLDIGADTPAEIANSIISEIQAVSSKRNASFLKYRSQPLHQKYDVQQKQVITPKQRLKVED
ncbi:MAG: XdhC family protein [Crocosphaera sp.]|nr:XdhC/CoxI family protein [Crocosphaera sp.]MCH2247231.1 XdhC family protein [Crocosphaera sp.]